MFRGSFTAVVTPFKNNQFDRAAFEKQLQFQAENGTNGIIPVGTTGESPTLSHEEHHHVFEVAVQAAKGTGMKVIAGTGSNSTEEALDLTRFAKKIGADAALMVNPYYNKPTQEGMYRHFKYVASQVDIPIVLYNIPGRTGVTMANSTVARLARECKNIVAMKEATGSLDSCSELCATMPAVNSAFTVLSGDDSMTVPFMSVGAVGVISVATNIIPKQVRQMVDAALGNDFAAARAIHLKHLELFKSLFLEGNPVGIKTAMQLLGRDTGEMRLPLCEPTAGTREAIKKALTSLSLL
ncbi:MAG TPA: 4-hydroxy-tetrahydrodipicolinate synthase [Phycisphaerae bacterium]|jgi:4-hydroxy-tetrahydrodipicolinate synthase|nr:4-hydroxy-tetrahydrodipicolinate synthase [Phycisphaerae bacterium]